MTKRLLLPVLAVASALAFAVPALAGGNALGPPAGTIYALFA